MACLAQFEGVAVLTLNDDALIEQQRQCSCSPSGRPAVGLGLWGWQPHMGGQASEALCDPVALGGTFLPQTVPTPSFSSIWCCGSPEPVFGCAPRRLKLQCERANTRGRERKTFLISFRLLFAYIWKSLEAGAGQQSVWEMVQRSHLPPKSSIPCPLRTTWWDCSQPTAETGGCSHQTRADVNKLRSHLFYCTP